MLTVSTYVAPSAIHGLGLYTSEKIPAGTTIWRFDARVDWRLSPTQLGSFPEPFQTSFRHYCYLEPDGYYVLCGDNAKFMNHADRPNCDDPEGPCTVTARDIEAREELTCDYRTFDVESAENGVLGRGRDFASVLPERLDGVDPGGARSR